MGKVIEKGIKTEKYNQLSPQKDVTPPAIVCPISINKNAAAIEKTTPNIRPLNTFIVFILITPPIIYLK